MGSASLDPGVRRGNGAFFNIQLKHLCASAANCFFRLKEPAMSHLKKKDLEAVRSALQSRKSELLERIRTALEESGDNQYAEILGRSPGDTSDEALATSLADLSAARIDREMAEYRALEAADKRVDAADFGICMECGKPIPAQRLIAYPSATRCVECQSVHERTYAGQEHGSL